MTALALPDSPRLTQNLTHFARALRKAGLPVGPGRVLTAIEAVAAAGFTSKQDFYWTLHAVFVSRPEERQVFAQVFRLFWRDPRYMEHMMALMLPAIRGVQEEEVAASAAKRAAEALLDGIDPPPPAGSDDTDPDDPRIEVDATQTASADERLRSLDFEQMSAAEAARARRMLSRLALPVRPLPTRRLTADPRGRRPDPRRTLRGALRTGGEVLTLAHRKPATRWPALVVLCDISGSMASYSRMVLHFVHAVANRQGQGWARVHAFTFGTRLTNITRHLRTRDVDAALNAAGHEARDWQGGTRIGACLHQFNRDWSRRVLGQGAVVLLITDGLDRDDPALLRTEMERLHLSAKRLIWLNPLLRWDGFAPRAQGIRAMLPHVDTFRASHSVASLEALAQALSDPSDHGEKARLLALLAE
ncbi:MAG: VWA domain-containing protein [Rhodobacter sp.]|uniref:vWA domain-containing protein n=1 Tax=Pararhodobacter sp. TaxID=2127056 RepID=UPI001D8E5A1C|nr:VWA domain-containing protein [Pararhodobacter sp.]MCB1345784.1 VWA domain-containing protein [Paracoccaceae bacterium]MCC0073967.1 VWA domain-containing protein [Rhodobacter sp.]HPD91323.1 VWA domain-containing protein [Pararhodobacter sp.]